MSNEKCSLCEGNGYIICPACNGKLGMAESGSVKGGWKPCSCCKGKGTITCPQCKGSGSC